MIRECWERDHLLSGTGITNFARDWKHFFWFPFALWEGEIIFFIIVGIIYLIYYLIFILPQYFFFFSGYLDCLKIQLMILIVLQLIPPWFL